MDRQRSSAALGTGAVVLVAAGLGIAIARSGDSGVEPSAGSEPVPSAPPSTSASPLPAPSVTPSSATTSARPRPGDGQHHGQHTGGSGGNGGNQSNGGSGGNGGGSGGQPSPPPSTGPSTLPYTGSPPLPATTALALLLAAGGAWTLVRVPAAPGEAPVVIATGAVDRLRAPRRRTS